MQYRHISVLHHSYLINRKQQNQMYEPYQQSVDQARTLNPQQPDNDVLITFKLTNQSKMIEDKQIYKNLVKRSSSVLTCELPQTISDFDIPAQEANQKERRIMSNCLFEKPDKTKQQLTRRWLSNDAYLRIQQQRREFKIIPILNKPQMNQQKVESEEQDNGIVNRHTKSSIVHGQVYRTLEKIQARNSKNVIIHPNIPVITKKYSYSLPKNKFTPNNEFQNEEYERHIKNQDRIQYKLPLTLTNAKAAAERVYHNHLSKRKNDQPLIQQDYYEQTLLLDAFDIPQKKQQQIQRLLQPKKNPTLKNKSQIVYNNKQKKTTPSSPIDQITQPYPNIQVSYKTSLSELKEICLIKQLDKIKLVMKIPEIFSYPLFTGLQEQSQLFKKSEQLLSHLQINSKKDMSIKKYNNCVLIIVNNIAIIWYYAGKVYLGGWKYEKVNDDAHKSGLGMQWSPKRYVYYGEFAKGKRHGIGIMKYSSNEIFAGIWHQNKYVSSCKHLQS